MELGWVWQLTDQPARPPPVRNGHQQRVVSCHVTSLTFALFAVAVVCGEAHVLERQPSALVASWASRMLRFHRMAVPTHARLAASGMNSRFVLRQPRQFIAMLLRCSPSKLSATQAAALKCILRAPYMHTPLQIRLQLPTSRLYNAYEYCCMQASTRRNNTKNRNLHGPLGIYRHDPGSSKKLFPVVTQAAACQRVNIATAVIRGELQC